MAVSRYRRKGPSYAPTTPNGTLWIYDYGTGGWSNPTPQSAIPVPGLYLCKDEQCWDETHPGPPYNEGGPLHILRQDIPTGQRLTSGQWSYWLWKYVGDFVFVGPQNMNDDLAGIADETAAGFGATAWKRFRPTKPRASLGQFIGELRDLPRITRSRLKGFKRLGDEYLNIKFGWMPFVNDIVKAVKLYQRIDRVIDYIRKNNGRWLHRRGTVRNDVSQTVATGPNVIGPGLPSYFYPGYATTTSKVTTKVTDEIWFEGVMKYYIPELSRDRADSVFTSPLLRRLYGLEIDPALMWELLPWTWLFDWFANTGDIIANISNQSYDNLVAKYAYVMRRRKIERTYSQVQPLVGGPSVNCSVSCFVESKERASASPFGFGVEWPDFTPSQLAILAALGVTRL